MTRAQAAVAFIRRYHHRYGTWPTYGDLLWAGGAGTSPWKRLAESGHKYLTEGEALVRLPRADGLVTFAIVRVKA